MASLRDTVVLLMEDRRIPDRAMVDHPMVAHVADHRTAGIPATVLRLRVMVDHRHIVRVVVAALMAADRQVHTAVPEDMVAAVVVGTAAEAEVTKVTAEFSLLLLI